MAHGRIIVGVDGSDTSLAALGWAGTEAEERHLPLVVVRAYTDPSSAASAWPPVPVLATAEDFEAEAKADLKRAVAKVLSPSTNAEQRVVLGDAERALTDMAGPDDLLVIGHRQHLAGALGSVARRVVAHARCPVVVIPSGRHVQRAR